MPADTPNPAALAYDEAGSGPPLLILHGLLGQARNWAGQMKLFAADHRVLAVDLRNHGRSPWVDGMTYEAMADDMTPLFQAVVDKVHSPQVNSDGPLQMQISVSRG